MTNKFNIAVVGATGNVGRKILEILDERNFPIANIYAVASKSSIGKKVSCGDRLLACTNLEDFDFTKVDIVFSCAGSTVLKTYYQKALSSGCYIIDKSSLFRMHKDVPLIVPEVNGHLVSNGNQLKNSAAYIETGEHAKARKDHMDHFKMCNGIIASPNCCVIPITTALSPLHNAAKIKRLVISTYQSVSGAGKEYMDELYNQTKSIFLSTDVKNDKFERRIAFNIIPKIDLFNDNGDTLEEQKIAEEIKKILGRNVEVTVTSVRVPVFVGHALSVNAEFEKSLEAEEAEEILEEADGVNVITQESTLKYITPIEVAGEDGVYVSRIRRDLSRNNSLNMWIVCDNLRKGAATNAVQIAEAIIRDRK